MSSGLAGGCNCPPAFILAQQQEIEQLRGQLTTLATGLASLRDLIGRNSLNASKPPPQRWPRSPLQHRAAEGEDPAPLHPLVIEIPLIKPGVQHRLHRLARPCWSTTTGATRPDVARQQPVSYVVNEDLRAAVETGAPIGNGDAGHPPG